MLRSITTAPRRAIRRARRMRHRSSAPKPIDTWSLPNDDEHRRWLEAPDVAVVNLKKTGPRLVRDAYPRLWEMAEQNRAVGLALLEAGDARYFDVGGVGVLRSTLAVPEPDWIAMLDSIADIDVNRFDAPIYFDIVRTGQHEETYLLGTVDRAVLNDCIEVRIYRLSRAVGSERVRGLEARCIMQKWRADNDRQGLYVSPGPGLVAAAISDDLIRTETVSEWGRERQRLQGFPSPLAVAGPVDAVYLWVDGSDPKWAERMLREKGSGEGHAYDISRFRDRGELKYSIRSLLLNAPWIRHIYLVTDAQVPAWLNLDSDRLTVVDHREIFSATATLPNFNSHAIASRVHHIPGLAEKYIIMNDDVFVNRPAAPDLFFDSAGGVIIPLARTERVVAPTEHLSPVDVARQNSARLIERDYGRSPSRLFRHTPVPQLKSLMKELEHTYSDVFEALEHSQFRSYDDHEVNGWLHHYVALMTHRGIIGRYPYQYINLAVERGREELSALEPTSTTVTFCINDVGDGAAGDDSELLERWLNAYFPEPSEVEL